MTATTLGPDVQEPVRTESRCDPGTGPDSGLEVLIPAMWEELRRIARSHRRRTGAGETLRTTALLNETWLKLRRQDIFVDDNHFLSAAAIAMRHVLVDHARSRLAAKRGAGRIDPLLEDMDPFWESDEQLIELNEALGRLKILDERLSRVVELRFFGGYTEDQTSSILGVSKKTAQRDWIKARAWLHRELTLPEHSARKLAAPY